MFDLYGDEYFDPAYLVTAEGLRELEGIYDGCPVGLFPDFSRPGCEVLKINPQLAEPPAYQTIEDYIRGFYFFDLRTALDSALRSGQIELPNNGTVLNVSDIYVDRLFKCRITPDDAWSKFLREFETDPVIQVDVIVSANVRIVDGNGSNQRVSRDRRMLFRMVIYINLRKRCFVPSGKIYLYSPAQRQNGVILDDYLIPYLNVGNMDGEADRMLEKLCAPVLQGPMCLDIKGILDKLDMKVRVARITTDFRFRGRVFFEEGDITVYGPSGEAQSMHVGRGTILLDERIICQPQMVLWTIVHEIYHFLQHREFFYLQKIYDDTLSCLSYEVQDYKQYGKDTAIYWLEWQADRMTARLLMPLKTAKPFAAQLLKSYDSFPRMEALEKTICDLANTYCVSKQAAKIRMVEMGYPEANGLFNFLDDSYVPAYCTSDGITNDRTPDISSEAALDLYFSDYSFRKLIDTGRFCYVENHFCLNSEKYIGLKLNGEPCLTAYARTHINECCIIFEKSLGERHYTYKPGVFNNEPFYRGPELYRPVDIPSENPMPKSEIDFKRFEIYMDALENTPLRFSPALKYHMKKRGFTQETLAEMVGISTEQMKRYVNNKVAQPVQRNVIAMCIAMKLEADLSDSLLQKGKCLPGVEREDMALLFVLHSMYERSISSCNKFLIDQGYAPLTKEEGCSEAS